MKFNYGVEIPINEDGSTMDYNGPNILVWITCDECKISLKKECFHKLNQEFNIVNIAHKEYEKNILQQKLSEYKKHLLMM
jgi:hypothetical protein